MTIALVEGTLIIGNGDVIESGSIVIEGERIISIGSGLQNIPDQALRISLKGKVALPGFIDCHTHLCLDGTSDPITSLVKESMSMTAIKASRFAENTLMAGVTTVRDAGGRGGIDLAVRDAVNLGIIKGPRILASRLFICMTGGHGWNMGGREADGDDDVRKAVREQVKEGADVIKFMATGGLMTPGEEPGATQFSESELCVGIAEAHKAGKKTFAHAQGTDGIISAIRAGIDSIEHGVFLNDDAIALMIEKNLPLVPTLTALYQIQSNGTLAGIPDFAVHKCVRAWPSHVKSAQMAARSGVRIALGTDAGSCCNPHGNNLQELKRLTEIGLSPMQAIEAGTRISAEVLGLENLLGTLEEGKLADIVVSDINPLENIEQLENHHSISMVIKSGKIFKQLN